MRERGAEWHLKPSEDQRCTANMEQQLVAHLWRPCVAGTDKVRHIFRQSDIFPGKVRHISRCSINSVTCPSAHATTCNSAHSAVRCCCKCRVRIQQSDAAANAEFAFNSRVLLQMQSSHSTVECNNLQQFATIHIQQYHLP